MQQECKILKTNVFGIVHSQKHLVIFLQKHFTSKHSNAINSINIIMNCEAHSGADRSDCVTSGLWVRLQKVWLKFFIDIIDHAALWPWGQLTPWKNWDQEYFLGDKDRVYIGLTTWPTSCAKCLEIWEPQSPGNLCSLQYSSTKNAVSLP